MLLMGSFELFQDALNNDETTFNRYDDYFFLYKFLTRFGASTASLMIASSICYPLDTLKRRVQINGCAGHKKIKFTSEVDLMQQIIKKDGIRGFYKGY